MARTIYKTRAVTFALDSSRLSDENDSSLSHLSVSYQNGSGLGSHSAMNDSLQLLEGDESSENQTVHVCDDDDEDRNLSYLDSSSLHKMSAFWSFFYWKKYLYFGLSKPTDYDVELLRRIQALGKIKTAFLIFLPLLILLLPSGLWHRQDFPFPQKSFASVMGSSFHFMHSWYSTDNVTSLFISPDEEPPGSTFEPSTSEQKLKQVEAEDKEPDSVQMSKEDVKIIIKEILKEDLIPRLELEIRKQKELEEIEVTESIKKELSAFKIKMDTLSQHLRSIQDKRAVDSKTALKFTTKNSEQDQHLQELSERIKSLQGQLVSLNDSLMSAKNCCRNSSEIDHHMTETLLSLMDENPSSPTAKQFKDWLSAKYASNKQLQAEIANIRSSTIDAEHNLKVNIEALMKKQMIGVQEKLKAHISKIKKANSHVASLSLEDIHKTVKKAILLYDADKTGQADYALESGGGAVVSTRCSETYNEGRPSVVLFGFPLWNMKSSPRDVIQPDMNPGQCWAFKGSQGYLVVELSSTIYPTSFTLEHIPKSLSPTGSIDSAPKDFSVMGLASEKDDNGKLLGEYTYDKDGDPLQSFPTQVADGSSYSHVELQIHSNHGDAKYTCLYRFRVHGIRA